MATGHPAAVTDAAADLGDEADLCTAVLGEELTAFLAGADTVAEFRSWLADGDDVEPRQIAARLCAATRVVLAFRAENAVRWAAPWLREAAAAGDHAPARLIRVKGDDEGTVHAVVQGAREWLRSVRTPSATPA